MTAPRNQNAHEHFGFKGNAAGLTLWAGAAVFLVVARGGLKLAVRDYGRAGTFALQGLYVIGALGFIYGERAVLMGKDPSLTFGPPCRLPPAASPAESSSSSPRAVP